MIDRGLEEYDRRSERIRVWERETEFEGEIFVWCLHGSLDGSSPIQQVAVVWKCTDARGGRHHQAHEFGLEAFGDIGVGLWWVWGGGFCDG